MLTIGEVVQQLRREMDTLDLPMPPQVPKIRGLGGGESRQALLMDATALALYPNVGKRRPGDVNWTTLTGQKCKGVRDDPKSRSESKQTWSKTRARCQPEIKF